MKRMFLAAVAAIVIGSPAWAGGDGVTVNGHWITDTNAVRAVRLMREKAYEDCLQNAEQVSHYPNPAITADSCKKMLQ